MSVLQTVLAFVVAPLAIIVLIMLLTLIPGRAKRHPRYRAGEPWEYPPQWWAGDQTVAVPGTGVASGSTRGGARGTW